MAAVRVAWVATEAILVTVRAAEAVGATVAVVVPVVVTVAARAGAEMARGPQRQQQPVQ